MSELALELIKRCLETKDPYLDLGRCGLTDRDFFEGSLLDDVLRQCRHLEALILSDKDNVEGGNKQITKPGKGKMNRFNAIPVSVSTLKNLKTLVIGGYLDS